MNELAMYQQNLPERVDDLARFVLIGREKITALKAEIRAIEKMGLAREVYDQKLEESRMLSELILDASVKLGEFTMQLPKAAGRPPEIIMCSAEHNFEKKAKSEVIQELGFNQNQIQRFETLAKNAEIVEQVKAEAREENRAPTQTEVLNRVKMLNNVTSFAEVKEKQSQNFYKELGEGLKIHKQFLDAIYAPLIFKADEDIITAIVNTSPDLANDLDTISRSIAKLTEIKHQLIAKEADHNASLRNY